MLGHEDDHVLPVDNQEEKEIVPLPGIISQLGELQPGAIITETGLANLFDRHVTSIKRAVSRNELPPPCRLLGRNRWTVRAIVQHIEARLEQAAVEQKRHEEKIKQLQP